MRIRDLLEVNATPFPSAGVKPTTRPPAMGAQIIPMEPYQQARQMTAQRQQMERSLDLFTRAYIEAALWSSQDENGQPLDQDHSISDISDQTLFEMIRDCQSFQNQNKGLFQGIDESQAGHDFWLTRCGHGAGFWDRRLGEIGDRLTAAAQAFGNVDLYVGDDGKIYA